jgi:hypothetical protein
MTCWLDYQAACKELLTMWRVTYWVPGSTLTRVAVVPADSHNEAVYQFELAHGHALILSVMEG